MVIIAQSLCLNGDYPKYLGIVFSGLFNGCVYETFGISKHFTIKLQVPLIRAETLDNPLTAKCFIYDVVPRFYFFFFSICLINNDFTYSGNAISPLSASCFNASKKFTSIPCHVNSIRRIFSKVMWS